MMGALLAKSDTVELPPGLDGEDDEVDMDVRRSCRYFYGVTVSVALISDLRVWVGRQWLRCARRIKSCIEPSKLT